MIPDFGHAALVVALFISLYGLVAGALAGFLRSPRRRGFAASASRAAYAAFAVLTLSSAALARSFLARDFSVEYVAEYSSRALSFWYTLAAFWAGQSGSLLLWAWLLAGFAALVAFQNRSRLQSLMPFVLAAMQLVLAFFLALLVFLCNPFARLAVPPEDGQGLNPLLQNPQMVFHPPALYLGYVGFTVPFAFAVATLVTGRLGNEWVVTTRKWTVLSWLFLTLGILLGAQWAYVELGWGGYWAWDPVENASLIPWLTGTAFLHSVMMQERRGMLKVWNMVLIILTFELCLFGTFLTRSGLLSSVHAFAGSNLGPFFLAFMGVTLAASFAALRWRRALLQDDQALEFLLSRESMFLLNNIVFAVAAFAVLWGTMYPVTSQALLGRKHTLSAAFYNRMAIPIGLLLLLLTGIGPLISWRRALSANLKRSFVLPLMTGVLVGLASYLAGADRLLPATTFGLGAFVLTTVVTEFLRSVRARSAMSNEPVLMSAYKLVRVRKRRYGAHTVHVGIVLLFCGIAGSQSFKVEKKRTLRTGQTMRIKDYVLTYHGLQERHLPDKVSVSGAVSVSRQGKPLGVLTPKREFYAARAREEEQNATEIALRSTWLEDLYIILGGWTEDESAILEVIVAPLVMWIWVGGALIIFGTLFALVPDGSQGRKAVQ